MASSLPQLLDLQPQHQRPADAFALKAGVPRGDDGLIALDHAAQVLDLRGQLGYRIGLSNLDLGTFDLRFRSSSASASACWVAELAAHPRGSTARTSTLSRAP